MKTTITKLMWPSWVAFTAALAVIAQSLTLTFTASAASSLTNSLTGYSGTSQDDYPAQPAFLAGSGLEASFVWGGGSGAWEKIGFDASGAAFGSFHGGSDGRNYLRTTNNNFAPVSFTAYVTVNRTVRKSVFFGMGTGKLTDGSYPSSKAPDYNTGDASVYLELQDGFDNASRRRLGGTNSAPINTEVGYNTMTTVTGLMTLRMDYDAVAKTVTFSVDYNPSGAFVADQTFAAVDVSSIAPEWASGEKSSIYFGGADGMIFSNFIINAALPVGGLDHFYVSASSPQTAGTAFNVTITAQDSSNQTVNDSTTIVTVNSPTSGSLMEFDWNSDGTYGDNSGTLVSGVKTIKARNKKAETVSITAIGGLGATPTPPDITTDPAAFIKLQILAPGETATPGTATGRTGTPNTQIINRAFNVSVKAVDAYWNVVNTVFDTVGIACTNLAVTLPADNFLIEGTNIFAVELKTNGTFTLTATNVTDNTKVSSSVVVTAIPVLQSPGVWASLPIIPNQTPSTNWSSVPVASSTNPQGTANWDVKDIKVCNDSTNLYFLVELWPGSTVTLQSGNIENYFWFDGDNNPASGYVNAAGTAVGAEACLRVWQVWDGSVRQVLWWGVTGNVSPNGAVRGPGGNPFGGWPADTGLYYEYSMSLAATNTDGSMVFPTNSVTIGFSSDQNGTVKEVIPAFKYTFATGASLAPGNPVAVQVSGGNFSFNITNSSGSFVVQVNSDLSNPAGWTPIYTNTAPFTFTDSSPVSASQKRFYRTVAQ